MSSAMLGQHLLLEFYNCHQAKLDDIQYIERVMNQAALDCGATIVQSSFHRFEPYGVSGVVVIAESHLAIHTWPEYRYASIDLYTCGGDIEPMTAHDSLKAFLEPELTEYQRLFRGDLEKIKRFGLPKSLVLELEGAAGKGGAT